MERISDLHRRGEHRIENLAVDARQIEYCCWFARRASRREARQEALDEFRWIDLERSSDVDHIVEPDIAYGAFDATDVRHMQS